jgi:PAS domain S-box-containing protein
MPRGTVLDLTVTELIRVLHVDDDADFLKVAKRCLEVEGRFDVDPALSVEEAMEKLKKEKYDAIISDFQMHDKTGLDFLKELRDRGNNVPFVMFTGKGREETAAEALNLGADGYFSKIGSPARVYGELAQGINQIVESKKAEEALRANESYLKTLFDSILAGLLVVDEKTHRILDVNSHALERIGASRKDVIGMVCHRFIRPAKKGICPITDLGQTVDRSETALLKADGGKVPILKTVATMTWKDHKYLAECFIEVAEGKRAERAMRESQENFKRLFMDNPEASVYMDSSFHIMDINPRFTELFGFLPDEVKGKHIDDVVVPKDKMKEGETLDRKALKGYSNYDTVRKRKDGSLIQVSVSGAPIMVEGKTIGYMGVYRDSTERKRYEERLSALNIHSRNLNTAETMEEIYRLTMDAVEKTLGFEIAFFMVADKNTVRVVDHRGYPEYFSMKLPLNGTKKGVSVEVARTGRAMNVPDAEKEDAWVEFMPGIRSALDVPVKIGNRVLGVIGVDSKDLNAFSEKDQELLEILAFHAATAISNLEHAKDLETRAREAQESQERFERLFMNNPEAAVYADSDFHVLDANPRFTELFGYSLDEIRGKCILNLIVPEDRKQEAEMLDREAKKVYTHHEDTVRKRKDGSSVPVSISASPITIEGQPLGYVAVYKDIMERKRYEERLSTLNIYSRNLNTAKSMEEIQELVLEAAEKTLGFEFADMLIVKEKTLRLMAYRGHSRISSLELPLDGDKGITVRAARTGKPILVPDISKDKAYVEGGEGIRSELAVPIKIGNRVLGVLNVESVKLDAFVEKDQELLEILASHAATAISNLEYSENLEHYAQEIRESQQKFERLFMDNPEAAVHLDSSSHILDINPRFVKLFGYSLDEIRGKHINDVIVPKNKTEEAVSFDERARKGETYQEDTVRKRKDGSLVPVAFSAAPIIIENQVIGHIAVYKDISQLKKAEDELRNTLKKLEKMNEKLRVVGGLTRHDARNKLGAITGNVYLARKKLENRSEVLNRLKEMEIAAEQMVRIFDFAKTYEMLGVEELRFIDVEKMVDEAVSLFSDLKGVKVINNCRGLTVFADSLLRQLFYNLVDNSLKYGERTKTITVYYEKTDENELKLVYEDDGVGIAEAEKNRIFGEGYGRGTGYGLYLIRKMCDGYGWNIQETGKEGEGAQFTITIPRIGEKEEINYSIS